MHDAHDHDHHGHDHDARRLASRRHGAARPRAGNAADREGLCRSGRARRLHRDLRDEDRPAQRRQGGGEGLERPGLSRAGCLQDATAAIASLGFTGRQGEHMVALENTPDTHNMVVCTLCSCYPVAVLGLPPVWYKSPPYRSRAVIDPRGVLAEFGVTLPEATKIRVWDSTAEIRYLVVPMRPAGTEGWSEERLAALVTRDSMIGTGLPLAPRRRHERPARSRRRAGLRPGRAGAGRAGLPRRMGAPRLRADARHGRRPAPGTSTCRATRASASRRPNISPPAITRNG